jgi:hypothetical protein
MKNVLACKYMKNNFHIPHKMITSQVFVFFTFKSFFKNKERGLLSYTAVILGDGSVVHIVHW